MAAPEESSPPMVAGSGRISVFLDLRAASSRDASETFIYGVFRSREPSGAFTGRLRCSEGEKRTGGAPSGWGAPPLLFPPSWLRLLDSKASYRHILENNDPRKIPGQFESV